jgi:lysophospholipase L1-like esterase
MSDPPDTPASSDRRFGARDALLCVLLAVVLLVVCEGDGIRRQGEQMSSGIERSAVLAVGHPAGWIADRLPFAAATDQVTGWLSSDDDLGSGDGAFAGSPRRGGGPASVAPQAFRPSDLGERARPRALRALLVTGDSLSQPLDAELARELAGRGVRTDRDPHLGTGISKSFLVDWSRLSAQQVRRLRPDAVVMFIGANEGFPMRDGTTEVQCCGPRWAALYATRARAVMDNYRRRGATQVYWLLLPAPRDPDRARISRSVNAAIRVAAGAFGAEVEVVDTSALFTPRGRYRDAMEIGGREQIVRESDGIHLNERGAKLLAGVMTKRLGSSFTLGSG